MESEELNIETQAVLKLNKMTREEKLIWKNSNISFEKQLKPTFETTYKGRVLQIFSINNIDGPESTSIMALLGLTEHYYLQIKDTGGKGFSSATQQSLKDLYQTIQDKASGFSDLLEEILKE